MNINRTTPEDRFAIVDDDESVREAAASLFRSMGFFAVAFASAEGFLSSDSLERTSCLVLDVQMPGMGGLTLQDHVAADRPPHPHRLRHGVPGRGGARRRAGVRRRVFFTKPFDEAELQLRYESWNRSERPLPQSEHLVARRGSPLSRSRVMHKPWNLGTVATIL